MTTIIKQFEWDSCSTAMDIIMTSAFIHYLHLPPRVDEVRGKYWHVVIAIHDEGDGLMLCE
jgi:hypothetical protein